LRRLYLEDEVDVEDVPEIRRRARRGGTGTVLDALDEAESKLELVVMSLSKSYQKQKACWNRT